MSTLPDNATEPMQKAMQRAVMLRKSMNDVWRAALAELPEPTADASAEVERMRRALHEIAEEWAGAECGEPVHAHEAYAIGLAKRMYALAVEGLTPNGRRCSAAHLCDCQEAGQPCARGLTPN